MIKGEKSKGQIKNKSNCASSVCVQTNAPRARWGSTPIPFDITGGTGDELSGDATLKIGKTEACSIFPVQDYVLFFDPRLHVLYDIPNLRVQNERLCECIQYNSGQLLLIVFSQRDGVQHMPLDLREVFTVFSHRFADSRIVSSSKINTFLLIPVFIQFMFLSQNSTALSNHPSATVPVPSPKPWGVMESDGFEKKKIKKEPADSPKRYLQTSSKCTNPK